MVNILFITYYGIRDQLKFASDALINQNNNMVNFSLMELENENKRSHGKEFMPYDLLIESIKINTIDLVLWWYIGTPYSKINYVVQRTPKVKHMLYNWDDPNGWEDRELAKKSKLFDCVFTCCKESVNKYLLNGAKNSFYLIPGYDPSINYVITDNSVEDETKYECDISIVCTTLYEKDMYDMKQYINRKELIDTLYKNREKFSFYIYGPRFLMEMYPECYRPYDIQNKKYEVPYCELNKIFNNSKINICTHTHCQYDGYFNERVGLILGSGGLLYIDKIKGLENIYIDGVDCIYIDKDNYIEQICQIIANYDDYYKIRTNGHEKNKINTWEEWAKYINNEYISKMYEIEPHIPTITQEIIIKNEFKNEIIDEIDEKIDEGVETLKDKIDEQFDQLIDFKNDTQSTKNDNNTNNTDININNNTDKHNKVLKKK